MRSSSKARAWASSHAYCTSLSDSDANNTASRGLAASRCMTSSRCCGHSSTPSRYRRAAVRGDGPAPEHLQPCCEQLDGTVLGQQRAPVLASLQRLMVWADIERLPRPVDRKIELANLRQCFGCIQERLRDLPVACVGADDRLDITVQHRQPLRVPVQGEPVMGVRCRPPLLLRWPWCRAGFDVGEPCPVGGHALLAERGRVGDGVEVEVVAFIVELERHHPVHQLRDRRLGPRCDLGCRSSSASARVSDDPAGVVGAHDHLQRGRDRLLRHREHDGRVLGLCCLLENRYRFVHLSAVLVRRAPTPQVRTSTDQRQHRVGKLAHGRQRFHVDSDLRALTPGRARNIYDTCAWEKRRRSVRANKAFWNDLARDLKDPEFLREYIVESMRIATVDAIVNELDDAREAAGLSKADLARAIQVEPATIRRLFAADRPNPTLGTLAEVAAARWYARHTQPLPSSERANVTEPLLQGKVADASELARCLDSCEQQRQRSRPSNCGYPSRQSNVRIERTTKPSGRSSALPRD